MTIGTYGSIKTIDTTDLKNCNVNIILSNAFHLMLRPGTKIIEKFGGLHQLYELGWINFDGFRWIPSIQSW